MQFSKLLKNTIFIVRLKELKTFEAHKIVIYRKQQSMIDIQGTRSRLD